SVCTQLRSSWIISTEFISAPSLPRVTRPLPSHRKVLIKVLNEAHVDKNIFVDKLEGIVSHINNHLFFSDEEIPAEGRGHNRALNISVKLLIENGSSLNVLPKRMLDRLPYDKNKMRDSSMIVRAFDGSRREVFGEIKILVQIGPFEF
ncbi:hypothetical protein CR513_19155, partial [Mucuna pruriens]